MNEPVVKINIPDNQLMTGLFGERDLHLKSIEAAFPEVDIHARGNQISISGADATRVGSLFEEMVALLKDGHVIDSSSLGKSIDLVLADERPSDILGADILRAKGKTIRCRCCRGDNSNAGPASPLSTSHSSQQSAESCHCGQTSIHRA